MCNVEVEERMWLWNLDDLSFSCMASLKCPNICTAHIHSLCTVLNDYLLSSTQADIANRDADIRQLEEKCEQLEAQVSPSCHHSLMYSISQNFCDCRMSRILVKKGSEIFVNKFS